LLIKKVVVALKFQMGVNILAHHGALPGCNLTEQWLDLLATMNPRGGEEKVKNRAPVVVAQALYLTVLTAPSYVLVNPTVVSKFLELLDPAKGSFTLSRITCVLVLAAWAKLQQHDLECSQLGVVLQLQERANCLCSKNVGGVEAVGAISLTKCLVDPSVACTGLPSGLELRPGVLASIASAFSGQLVPVGGVSVVRPGANWQACLQQHSASKDDSIASNITSITIFDSQCRNVSVANTATALEFELPLIATADSSCTDRLEPEKPTEECRYFDKQARLWSSAGCTSERKNATRVLCKCSHLTGV
jgi:hypothetical protein